MEGELNQDQQSVLRLCCEAAGDAGLPYWEGWFSAKDVLSRYATRENRREGDLAVILQSLINQGYIVLPPAERQPEAAESDPSLPAACQITGLGFEKYAQATFASYLDWVERVGVAVESSHMASSAAMAEQLGLDRRVVEHIIHYHGLLEAAGC